MSTRGQYHTDVMDGQRHLLQRLLPKPCLQLDGLSRRSLPLRKVLNGVLYVTKLTANGDNYRRVSADGLPSMATSIAECKNGSSNRSTPCS